MVSGTKNGRNRFIRDEPRIDPSAFVAASADLIGGVMLGREASVWYQAVIRADDEPVTIGDGTNVQDGVIIHIDPGEPTTIGAGVTIGHRAMVHGAVPGRAARLADMLSRELSTTALGNSRCATGMK